MTKLRLWGTRDECSEITEQVILMLQLGGHEILSVSGFYENNRNTIYPHGDPRNKGRVYIEFY